MELKVLFSKNLINSFAVTSGNVLKMIFGIVLIPIYSRYVAPEELGKFDFLLSFVPLISQIISMGTTNSIARFQYAEPSKYYVGYIYKFIKKRSLISAIVLILVGIVFYNQIDNYVGFVIFLLFTINLVFENITFVSNYVYSLEEKFPRRAVISLISVLIRYSTTILLVIILDNKLLALVLGMTFSWLFLIIQTHYDNYKVLRLDKLDNVDINKMFKYSRPLFVLGVFSFLYQTSDRIFLGTLLKENAMSQLGFWGMAQRSVTVLSIALSGFLEVWSVTVFKGNDKNVLIKEQRNYMSLIVLASLSLVLLMQIFKPFVIKVLFTETYKTSFELSIGLIAIFCWTKLREILEKSFMKEGNTRLVSNVFILFSILLLAGNLFAIPKFGIIGLLFVSIIINIIHTYVLYFFNISYGFKISHIPVTIALILTGLITAFLIR